MTEGTSSMNFSILQKSSYSFTVDLKRKVTILLLNEVVKLKVLIFSPVASKIEFDILPCCH